MTDISEFDSAPPEFSVEELEEIALRHFGIRGEIVKLDGERDLNVKITAGSDAYVLKIANAGEDAGIIAMQCAALDHLKKIAPGIGVPRVVPARDGAQIVNLLRGNEKFLARMVTYLHGKLLGSVPTTPKLARSLGSFLGKFSRAMQGFGHPAAHRRNFLWNLETALDVSGFVDEIESEEVRKICRYCLSRYESFVRDRLPKLRAATLHQDANDSNIVLNAANHELVVGVIDFGDMVFGRQINELAVAWRIFL